MHLKDVLTGLIKPTGYCKNAKCKKIIAKSLNRSQYRLRRENEITFRIRAAVFKWAASTASTEAYEAGTAIPAPDYIFTCPICGTQYTYDHILSRFKYGGKDVWRNYINF